MSKALYFLLIYSITLIFAAEAEDYKQTPPFPYLSPRPNIAINNRGDLALAQNFFGQSSFMPLGLLSILEQKWNNYFIARTSESSPEVFPNPNVAIDKEGNSYLIWVENNTVWVGIQPISPLTTLFKREIISSESAEYKRMKIVVHPSGEIRGAAYQKGSGEKAVIEAVIYRNGKWGKPIVLSPSNCISPVLGMDKKGNAIVAWLNRTSGKGVVQARQYLFESKKWMPKNDISDATLDSRVPHLAVSGDGNAVIVWADSLVKASQFDSTMGWQTPITISHNEGIPNMFKPKVGVDIDGNAEIIWSFQSTPEKRPVVQTATLLFTDTESSPTRNLSNKLFSSIKPQIDVNKKGDAVAAWNQASTHDIDEKFGVIRLAKKQKGGEWKVRSQNQSPKIDEKILMDVSPRIKLSASGTSAVTFQLLFPLGAKEHEAFTVYRAKDLFK